MIDIDKQISFWCNSADLEDLQKRRRGVSWKVEQRMIYLKLLVQIKV